MTSLATALLVFVAFLVGCCVGAFERRDRRVSHEAPRMVELHPRSGGLVREVGNWRRM